MAAHFGRAPTSNRGRGMQGEWLNILTFVARARARLNVTVHDAARAVAPWPIFRLLPQLQPERVCSAFLEHDVLRARIGKQEAARPHRSAV